MRRAMADPAHDASGPLSAAQQASRSARGMLRRTEPRLLGVYVRGIAPRMTYAFTDGRRNRRDRRSPHRQAKNLSQRDICQIVQSLKIRAFKSPRACIKQT